jgi:TRAP-type mannitol/chloroaromatic compound transport system substrate-binding protein
MLSHPAARFDKRRKIGDNSALVFRFCFGDFAMFRQKIIPLLALLLALSACGEDKKKPAADSAEGGDAPAAQSVLLKTPVAFASTLPALGTPIKFISAQLNRVSGGDVQMKFYEPGKLVQPFEILESVSDGKINSGYTTPGYWAGKIPASPLFAAVPFGPEAPEYMAWLYYGNGLKLWQEMYDTAGYKVKVLPCAIISPETSGWFKEKITSPEQLRGLNIRFFGLGGKVMEKLGANPSLLPGGEIFGALEKGQIDATEFSMPAIDERLGFYKIIKNNYFPGWHQQATIFELLINKGVWEDMSDQQQAIVETVCLASMTNSLSEAEAIQGETLVRQVQENGVSLEYWSDDMLNTYRAAWEEVIAEQTQDEFFKKVWDDLSKFRESYDLWERHAFLPRR